MRIISPKKLREHFEKDENSKVALQEWIKKVKKSNWNNFSEVKKTFNSVDSVGNSRFVFNIKGNHYRLVTLILFEEKRVYIRWIGTHHEYSRIEHIDRL